MGRRVSWEQRECGQARERQDPEGKPLAARHARRGSQRCQPDTRHVLTAQYHGRLGRKKAIMAVAHNILIIIYHMLQRGRPTKTSAISTSRSHAVERRLTRRLERLGHRVTLELVAA